MDLNKKTTQQGKLSLSVRIIVGVLALPSLLLAFMLISEVINGRSSELGGFEIIYSLVGFFAVYIALTGKRFF